MIYFQVRVVLLKIQVIQLTLKAKEMVENSKIIIMPHIFQIYLIALESSNIKMNKISIMKMKIIMAKIKGKARRIFYQKCTIQISWERNSKKTSHTLYYSSINLIKINLSNNNHNVLDSSFHKDQTINTKIIYMNRNIWEKKHNHQTEK